MLTSEELIKLVRTLDTIHLGDQLHPRERVLAILRTKNNFDTCVVVTDTGKCCKVNTSAFNVLNGVKISKVCDVAFGELNEMYGVCVK